MLPRASSDVERGGPMIGDGDVVADAPIRQDRDGRRLGGHVFRQLAVNLHDRFPWLVAVVVGETHLPADQAGRLTQRVDLQFDPAGFARSKMLGRQPRLETAATRLGFGDDDGPRADVGELEAADQRRAAADFARVLDRLGEV